VLELLNTREGHYSTACALDFMVLHYIITLYYDSFALRDINRDQTTSLQWPYFLASTSRRALMAHQPVLVQSCWNGLAVFQAESFCGERPLRFRGIPDSLAEGTWMAASAALFMRIMGRERVFGALFRERMEQDSSIGVNILRDLKEFGFAGSRIWRWGNISVCNSVCFRWTTSLPDTAGQCQCLCLGRESWYRQDTVMNHRWIISLMLILRA
jgi:hypothetical protein